MHTHTLWIKAISRKLGVQSHVAGMPSYKTKQTWYEIYLAKHCEVGTFIDFDQL